jgi:hypothetical protein
MDDGKKRHLRIIRPTLRQIEAQVRKLKRNQVAWRKRLAGCEVGDHENQGICNLNLARIVEGLNGVQRYLSSLSGDNTVVEQ